MSILGIIPARYDSTRFPGKPLVVINGKTMIRRVYEQSLKCASLEKVVVATDNDAIYNHVRTFGGNVMMTSPSHRSGTERCQEVAAKLSEQGENYRYIINIQGDEPCIDPEQIAQLAACLQNSRLPVATLIKRITSLEELENPNVVKVVTGTQGQALYFSRSVVPYPRGVDKEHWISRIDFFKHIGIYGYDRTILTQLVALEPSVNEQAESLEQLRWLSHGFGIQTKETEYESISVDTPEDVLKIPSGV